MAHNPILDASHPAAAAPAADQGIKRSVWLDAWSDPAAGIRALGSCVLHTCNVAGDDDWRLVVTDHGDRKLKVWQGTHKASEHQLPDVPVGVTSFYPEAGAVAGPQRVPLLAVAAGDGVHVFRHLKPCSRFTVPPASAESTAAAAAPKNLDGMPPASPATSNVTCITSLKLRSDEPDAASCLVLGTGDKRLLVLRPDATAVAHSLVLPALPSFLATSGTLAGGCRISAAARDSQVYTAKGPNALCEGAIRLDAPSAGLVRLGKQLLVGTMARAVHCYGTSHGPRPLYTLRLPAPLACMQPLVMHRARPVRCLLVSLANGEVRVYNERTLVSVHALPSPAWGLAFGRYGREDATLLAVTKAGTLDIKILPRSANLEVAAAACVAPDAPPPPLPVPKTTQLAAEMMRRERNAGPAMYAALRRDMLHLKVVTERALLKLLGDGKGATAQAPNASVCMSVSVRGLGPVFRLAVSLRNDGDDLLGCLMLVFLPEVLEQYWPDAPHVPVPALVPGLDHEVLMDVQCRTPTAPPGKVQVLAIWTETGATLMTALVQMPACEPDDG